MKKKIAIWNISVEFDNAEDAEDLVEMLAKLGYKGRKEHRVIEYINLEDAEVQMTRIEVPGLGQIFEYPTVQ